MTGSRRVVEEDASGGLRDLETTKHRNGDSSTLWVSRQQTTVSQQSGPPRAGDAAPTERKKASPKIQVACATTALESGPGCRRCLHLQWPA